MDAPKSYRENLTALEGSIRTFRLLAINASLWTVLCAILSYNEVMNLIDGSQTGVVYQLATTAQIVVTVMWAASIYRDMKWYIHTRRFVRRMRVVEKILG